MHRERDRDLIYIYVCVNIDERERERERERSHAPLEKADRCKKRVRVMHIIYMLSERVSACSIGKGDHCRS